MDPILLSVIHSRLQAVGREMGVTMERSAHSPLMVEGRDFSLGIYTRDGLLLEQTEYIPVLGYAAGSAVKAVVKYFGDDIADGDVILHNDTFSGANQNSDWKVLRPVFYEDECVAWTVVSAHQADTGGAVPGSYNPNATDLWQEGIRITPVKIHERGKLRRDVWDLVVGNVRLPVVGDDVTAMVGGCMIGARGLCRLIGDVGLSTFHQAIKEIFDATERQARAVISVIPEGTYRARCWANDDAFDHAARLNIDVAITVRGGELIMDFSGTHEQTRGYVNAPYPVAVSSAMIAFFMLCETEIPHNDAITRCIKFIIPEGSMLNPRFPAASGFGNHLSDQICSVIMQALADAMPKRVTAGWNPLLCSIVNGVDGRNSAPFVDIFINACKGGGGATFGADGYDHIGLIASGGAIAAQDPEMFEKTNPVRLDKFEYWADSAGAGKWRGGLGVETVMTFLSPGSQASVFGDGVGSGNGASGLFGGAGGAPNKLVLTYPNGRSYQTEMKDLVSDIPAGTIYHQFAGGGGGYGDPIHRDMSVVASDVLNGFVSVTEARTKYGVSVSIDQESGAVTAQPCPPRVHEPA